MYILIVRKAEAASQLGSETKWYPNDKGYVKVLSDVSTDKYDTRFFMRGTIYYKTTGKLNVQAQGYYRTMYGDVYLAATELASESKTTVVTTNRRYSAAQDTPICNSTYKNKAMGYSNLEGNLTVSRY